MTVKEEIQSAYNWFKAFQKAGIDPQEILDCMEDEDDE